MNKADLLFFFPCLTDINHLLLRLYRLRHLDKKKYLQGLSIQLIIVTADPHPTRSDYLKTPSLSPQPLPCKLQFSAV